jgi:serine/threonine protein kinase
VKLGPYEIERTLGEGGMGTVLEGRGPDGRRVAVKLVHGATQERAQRFQREQDLLATLGEEEGFVALLDAGWSERGPYFVMPLVSGGTLLDRLAHGALDTADAVELVTRLAQAMGRAHSKGIVHRDLKPANVLLTADGRPLIADLGLGKHFRAAPAEGALSRTGEARGTLGYMAPEQLEDAKHVGPQADVFALGTILYECLSGVRAFPGESQTEVLMRVIDGRYTPLRRVCPQAPAWLARVVERALSPQPVDRFPDCDALAAALAAARRASHTRGPVIAAAVIVGSAALISLGFVLGAQKTSPASERPPPDLLTPQISPDVPPSPSPPPVPTLRPAWTIQAHEGAVHAVVWADAHERVLSIGQDETLRHWEATSGRALERAPYPPGQPLALITDANETIYYGGEGGQLAMAGFRGQEPRLISANLATLHTIAFFEPKVLMFHGDGKVIAIDRRTRTSGGDGSLDASLLHTPPTFGRRVADGALLSRGELRLVLDQPGGGVWVEHFWDQDRFRDCTLPAEGGEVTAIRMLPAGRRVLVAAESGTISLWDIEAGEPLASTSLGEPAQALALSPRGTRFATATRGQGVQVWDTDSFTRLASHDEGQGDVSALAFSADERALVAGTATGSLLRFDAGD